MTETTVLAGRVALVTGGSGGIGAAICRELARHGAAVAIGYGSNARVAEDLAEELRSGGAKAQAFGADLAEPAASSRLVDEVEQALGEVEMLVANHGIGRRSNYQELDVATFDRTLAINLRAPFLLAQRVLPGMCAGGFGRVLFVSSVAALRGGIVGADYAASKSGLHGMAHYLAGRVARDGVTVNVIAPGLIETAMLPGDPAELAQSIPVGRLGRPEEVADLTLAILRNGYLNNQVVSIDGGIYPR